MPDALRELDVRRNAPSLTRVVWLAIALAILPLVIYYGHIAFEFFIVGRSQSFVLENRSGFEITDAVVEIQDPNETKIVSLGALQPDSEHVHKTNQRDGFVTLRFMLYHRQYSHRQLIDLWTGETFVFRIQPDGSVLANYSGNMPAD